MKTSLLLTTALGLAAANPTTIIGYLAADWPISIPTYASTAASISDINAVATTYAVNCIDDTPKSLCHIETPWILIQGPETFSFTGVYTAWSSGKDAVTVTRDSHCSFTSSTVSASCYMSLQVTGTNGGSSYSTATSGSSSFATDHVSYYAMPVTGGLELFSATKATQTPAAAVPTAGPVRALITAAPLAAAAAVALL